jgi:HAD superfamily hydrolase (TIGR01490 family)
MNLALFDFDGTITSNDTWTPFMRLAVPRANVLTGLLPMLPVFVGYRMGQVSASTARQAAVRAGFRGVDAAAVRRLGAEYAAATIPATVRPAALERIEWHKAQGDRVVVVSGSLDVYLAPWCTRQSLDVICTTLEERDGRLTGRLVEGDCTGAEKARRVRRQHQLDRYDEIYAYGDTSEDREMLDLAHKKYYQWREVED